MVREKYPSMNESISTFFSFMYLAISMLQPVLLLPLYSAGGLRRYIVDHPVDALYFVDYPVCYPLQYFRRNPGPVSRHAVEAGNGPDRDNIFIRPFVAHDSDAFNWKNYSKGLPDVPVQSCQLYFLKYNRISFSQHIKFVCRSLADASYGKSRAGKGLPPAYLPGKAQFLTQDTHFIFKKLPQGLNKF